MAEVEEREARASRVLDLQGGHVLTSRRASWPWAAGLASHRWSLAQLITVYAVALIIYLPLENGLIESVPAPLYWVLRLLPDALVGALAFAVVAFGDRSARTLPVRILWIAAAVAIALIVANAARSISVIDSVNAIRVLVRYMALGLLLWWAIAYGGGPSAAGVARLVVLATLTAGAIEILLVVSEIAERVATGLAGAAPITPSFLFFVDGSLGRYDRLGLLLMVVAIAALSTVTRRDLPRLALLVASVLVLYLTTSRQAMAGLTAGALVVAVLGHGSTVRRALSVATALAALGLILITPSRLPASPAPAQNPDGGGPAQPGPVIDKGSTDFSIEPNRNFRLYYSLDLAPWAIATEPLLGFGPGQHVAEKADPRLMSRVESTGMSWTFARRFTNDSNYASLAIQFGAVAPGLFLLLVLGVLLVTARAAIRGSDWFPPIAVAIAIAVLVAAAFGPAFEIRPLSIVFWVALMTAVAGVTRRTSAD